MGTATVVVAVETPKKKPTGTGMIGMAGPVDVRCTKMYWKF